MEIPIRVRAVFRGLALALALTAAVAARASEHPDFVVKVTGQGRPVVFIPGLSTPGEIWQPAVDQLQAAYQCHVLSVAGFAGLPPTGTDPLLAHVRDEIIGYIREQKLDHPVIVGHSMGGMMALWVAETAPELPGGLIVVDALPFQAAIINPTATEESARAQIAPRAAFYSNASPAEFAAFQQTMLPQYVTSPEQARLLAEKNGRSDPKTIGRALSEIMSTDLREDLGKIRCPALVIGALAEKVVHAPREEVVNAFHLQYAKLAGVRFEMFDHARHFIMLDDPAGFVKALGDELAARTK